MADFVEPDDPLGSLVASDDDPYTPDAALDETEIRLDDPTLFGDDMAQDDVVVETAPQVYSLGRSWAFDFGQGRFVRDGRKSRSALRITGIPQLQQWIAKALYTPKGALPIHSDDYGLEDADGLIGQPFNAGQSASLRRRVEECLTFHPKIIGIEDFDAQVATYDDEVVEVSFTVRLDNGEVVPFETRLQ